MLLIPPEILLLALLWFLLRYRSPTSGAGTAGKLLLASASLCCLAFAAMTLLMAFRIYDDEGYVLHSLRQHLDGAALYDQVQSLYGPFLFLWWKALGLLGIPPSHDNGRILTLVYWALLSAGTTGLTWRLTKSLPATLLTLCLTTVYLRVLADEPTHPVALIAVLFMLAAWLYPAGKTAAAARTFSLGTLCGALLLTKFNTGIFLLAGCGVWFLWTRRQLGPRQKAAFLGAAALLLALPPVLMRSYWNLEGVALHALVTSCCFLAGLATSSRSTAPASEPAQGAPASLAGLCVSIIIILSYAWGTGSTLAGLADGLLLSHLRNAGVFHIPMPWLTGTTCFTLACAALCGAAPVLKSPWAQALCRLPCLVAATAIALAWCGILPFRTEAMVLSLGLPAACTALIPAGGRDTNPSFLLWLFLLATTHTLHAFPVAGTHLAAGSLLLIPLLFRGSIDCLAPLLANTGSKILAPACSALIVGVAAYGLHGPLSLASHWMPTRHALDLPGARHLMLSPARTGTLRVLETNARHHGKVLFTNPGLLSFNLWSGVPTPTTRNVTFWAGMLSTRDQEQVAEILRANPAAVVIQEDNTRNNLAQLRVVDNSLTRCLDTDFTTLFSLGSYSFRVRKGADAVPLDLMQVSVAGKGVLELDFIHPFAAEGSRLVSVELIQFTPTNTGEVLAGPGAGGESVRHWPVDLGGRRLGETSSGGFPMELRGLQRMTIRLAMPGGAPPPAPNTLMLVLRDEHGRAIGHVLVGDRIRQADNPGQSRP